MNARKALSPWAWNWWPSDFASHFSLNWLKEWEILFFDRTRIHRMKTEVAFHHLSVYWTWLWSWCHGEILKQPAMMFCPPMHMHTVPHVSPSFVLFFFFSFFHALVAEKGRSVGMERWQVPESTQVVPSSGSVAANWSTERNVLAKQCPEPCWSPYSGRNQRSLWGRELCSNTQTLPWSGMGN